jgi:NRAMP (natural resistance-associated macrophage protein)-like metal ion transporter
MRQRLMTLLAIMGPGVIVMVADNDAGSLATYAQAGQDRGFGLLLLVLLLAPVLFVMQEMAARLGAVTGAGHCRLIYERFGRRWGAFALIDLLLVDALLVVTEFIGIAFGFDYFGVSRYVSVPLAAVILIVVTSTGSFRRWEQAMYVLVGVSLLAVPLAVLSRAHHHVVTHAAVPLSDVNGNSLLLVIALIGTVITPWQLFFQQSNVVDKRITARWLNYERLDTLIGTLAFVVVAVAVLVTCAVAFAGTPLHGAFVDAEHVAAGLRQQIGPWGGALFALAILNGSLLGAGAVTLATSYAIGDVSGVKHSLHRRWRDAPMFHGSFVALVALAGGVVLIPGTPLGIVTVGVQALAGVLLPSAAVFLLLLCNDAAVLGPWTNPPWLNAVATVVVGALVTLSALLTINIVFPALDLAITGAVLATLLVLFLAILGIRRTTHRTQQTPPLEMTPWERSTWTMPRLESLPPPELSRARRLGLRLLRGYLSVAGLLVIVKIVQLIAAA